MLNKTLHLMGRLFKTESPSLGQFLKIAILSIVVVCVGSFATVNYVVPILINKCSLISTTPRPIVSQTVPLQNQWSLHLTISETGEHLLIATPDTLIVSDSCNFYLEEITALDLATGQRKWKAHGGKFIMTLDSGNGRLYTSISQPDEYVGRRPVDDWEIDAISSSDGKLLWSSLVSFEIISKAGWVRNIGVLDDKQAVVYTSNGGFILDTDSGNVQPHPAAELPAGLLLYDQDIAYFYRENSLEARNNVTGQTRWYVKLPLVDLPYTRPKELYDNQHELIVTWGDVGDYQKGLTAIDRQTGAVLWANLSIGLASNVAEASGILYALDYNGQLWLFDVNSGETIGKVQFEEPKGHLIMGPDALGGSYLAVTQNTLAIYFQDTHVLSTFLLPQ